MAFVRTDKAKSEKEKNSKGFTATSSLKIDSDYVEKKRKKASDKLTDFADRYTALMKDAEKYLTRAENEPIETGVTANTKKGNTLAGEAVKSNVSGRKTSAYSPSTAGKASSKAKAAAEWADSILKADTLKSEAGNIKSEAAKLLKELDGDKSYMSTEMYNTYKELLSSVANDNSTGLSDALTREAQFRKNYTDRDDYLTEKKNYEKQLENSKKYAEKYKFDENTDILEITALAEEALDRNAKLKRNGKAGTPTPEEEIAWLESEVAKRVTLDDVEAWQKAGGLEHLVSKYGYTAALNTVGKEGDARQREAVLERDRLQALLDEYSRNTIGSAAEQGDYKRSFVSNYGNPKDIRAQIDALNKEIANYDLYSYLARIPSEEGFRKYAKDYTAIANAKNGLEAIRKNGASMTNTEAAIYNYLRDKNPDQAEDFLELLSSDLYDRSKNEKLRTWAEIADKSPILSSGVSVLTSLGGGLEYLAEDLIPAIAKYPIESLQGKAGIAERKTSDTYLTDVTNTIRGEVSKKFSNKIGEWDAGAFVYNTTMSGIDSAVSAMTLGSAGGLTLGLSAASQGSKSALEKGLTNEQAFWAGVFSGTFEMFFEEFSIGQFKVMQENPVSTFKDLIKNMAKSMGVNLLEEAATETANILYDYIAHGDLSDYAIRVEELKAQNEQFTNDEDKLTDEEIKAKVWGEMGLQVVEAAASGALMGFGMTAAADVSNSIASINAKTEQGHEIIKNYGDAESVAKFAMELNGIDRATYEQFYEKEGSLLNAKANKKGEYSDSTARLARKVYEAAIDENAKTTKTKREDLIKSLLKTNGVDSDKVSEVSREISDTMGDSNELRVLKKKYADDDAVVTVIDAIETVANEAENAAVKSATEKTFESLDVSDYNVKPEAKGIKKISAITDADATIVDSAGNEVSAYDAELTKDEAVIINGLQNIASKVDITPETANLVLAEFANSNSDAATYILGVGEAIRYGKFGVQDTAALTSGEFAKNLPQNTQRVMLEEGRRLAKLEDDARQAKAEKTEKKASKGKIGAVYAGEGIATKADGSIDMSQLDAKQQANIRGIEAIAKVSPLEFHVFRSKLNANGNFSAVINGKEYTKAPNGLYYPGTNEIWIDLNAGINGEGLMLWTAGHEIAHYIRDKAPAQWRALAGAISEEYLKNGKDFEGMLKDEIAAYSKSHKGESLTEAQIEDGAYEELISEALTNMLTDGSVVEFMADVKQKDAGLWATIKKAITDLLKRWGEILKFYKDAKLQTREAIALEEIEGAFNRVQKLFREAFAAANEAEIETIGSRNLADFSEAKHSERKKAPTFYSQMGKVVDGIKDAKIGATSVVSYLKGKGVKNEEIKWSGIETFLEGKKSVTKEELQAFVASSMLDIEETVKKDNLANKFKSKAKLKKISADTYEVYKDGKLIDTLKLTENHKGNRVGVWVPNDAKHKNAWFWDLDDALDAYNAAHTGDTKWSEYKLKGGKNYREIAFSIPNSDYTNDAMIKHWGIKTGVVAHARVQDMVVNGKKMLFIEELQSDWHNEGRKSGYEGDAKKEGPVPNAPFKDTYHEFVLKRLMRMAAEEGYDTIGWTQSDTQSARWSEAYSKAYHNTYDIRMVKFMNKEGGKWGTQVESTDLPAAAETVYVDNGWSNHYDSVKAWKDTVLYSLKEDGVKRSEIQFTQDGNQTIASNTETGETYAVLREVKTSGKIWSMEITDSMKDSVLYEGQALYSQRKTNESTEALLAEVQKENKKLSEDVTRLRELVRLQSKLTHGQKFTKTSVEAAASRLMKTFGMTRGKGELVSKLNDFYTYIASNEQLDWEDIEREATNVIAYVDDAVTKKPVRTSYAQEVLDTVRGPRITLTEAQKAEAAARFGTYNNFRKHFMGSLQIVNEGGIALDSIWNEWAELFPGEFAEDITEGDMVTALADTVDQLKQAYAVEAGTDEMMRDREWVQAIYNSYWDVSTLHTVADRYQGEINRLRSKHYESVNAIREKHEATMAEFSKKNREAIKAQREQRDKALSEYKKQVAETRAKNVEGRKQTAARNKIKRVVSELATLFNRPTKKKNVKEGAKDLVATALATAEIMCSDNISNEDIVRRGFRFTLEPNESTLANRYADALKEADRLQGIIDELKGTEDAVKKEKLAAARDAYWTQKQRMKELDKKLAAVFKRESEYYSSITVKEMLSELSRVYGEIKNSSEDYLRGAFDESVYNHINQLATNEYFGANTVRNMDSYQLEHIYKAYRMVLQTIRNSNKLFSESIKQKVDEAAYKTMDEVAKYANSKNLSHEAVANLKKLGWGLLKPIYAFRIVGSETLNRLYGNIRKAQDTWYRDVNDAKQTKLELDREYGKKNWDLKETYKFTAADGTKFELTMGQMMSIYAYSRRAAADGHLSIGGISFPAGQKISKRVKIKGKKTPFSVKYVNNGGDAYVMTDSIIAEITKKLSEIDPKHNVLNYVVKMQDYLSEVMGAKGNEVSMKMYGVEMYTEKAYFPLKSDTNYMESKKQEAGDRKIVNESFTHALTPNASNTIVIEDFFDVWSNHVNRMSMYHAFALPLEDFNKVYTFGERGTGDGVAPRSVRKVINKAYGNGATSYITNLMTDLNGGARVDNSAGFIGKLITVFKRAATFLSSSVVLQQPSAIVRAQAYIDPKYFAGKRIHNTKGHVAMWEQIKKYAPVAGIKEMGYFNTGMGRNTIDWLNEEANDKFREKIAAFFTDGSYRDEVLSRAPALADEIGWCAIWRAVQRETADKTNLKPGSEEFLEACGERFSDVIELTQVYDSVLSRSQVMRSPDYKMKEVTAFMAEPMVQLNMYVDAAIQGKRIGGKEGLKVFSKTVTAVVASVIANAMLKSLATAWRDDDEDKTFVEKYIGDLWANFLDGVNPLTLVPYLRDIVSVMQGYDVKRSDMTAISDIVNSTVKLSEKIKEKDEIEFWSDISPVISAYSVLVGIPVKNLARDIKGIWNAANSMPLKETTYTGIKYALREAIEGDISNATQLYEDYVSGNEEHFDMVVDRYKTPKDAMTALKKQIGERYRDGEIPAEDTEKYLIDLYENKKSKKHYEDKAEELGISVKEVKQAEKEDAAYWQLDKWDYIAEHGEVEGYTRYDEFYEAIDTGKGFNKVIKRYLNNGYDHDDLAREMTKHFKPLYQEMSKSERVAMKNRLITAYSKLRRAKLEAEGKYSERKIDALVKKHEHDKSGDIDEWLEE